MANIALGSVGKIIEVGLAIKEAVETVKQNKKDCLEMKNRVLRVTVILQRLDETMTMEPEMGAALHNLEETLRHALTLVLACQERHIVCLFCKAGKLSKQLRRVQDDIRDKMMIGVFATVSQNTVMLRSIECSATLPHRPQNAGMVGSISHSSDSTIDSRMETDVRGNNSSAESDTFASLPGFTKFTLSELLEATDNFSLENLIGEGGTAKVYKGTLKDGQVVAVKRFKKKDDDDRFFGKRMKIEMRCVSKLVQNKNIVKCLGYAREVLQTSTKIGDELCLVEEEHFLLVQEYMTNGDLEEINCGTRADWSSRLQLIKGIAQGVCYLYQKYLVHMDLKPSNILLDSDTNAKITDFGISRAYGGSSMTTKDLEGTLVYMPPEYVFQHQISPQGDVYAFGIILLKTIIGGMCKGDPPSRHAAVERARKARDSRPLKELLDPSLYDESQLKQIKACMEMGLRCAEMDRLKRPAMVDVVAELDRMKDAGSLKNPSILR